MPSKYGYIRDHDLVGTFLRGIRWNALLWLIPGVCIIGAALYFSAKE